MGGAVGELYLPSSCFSTANNYSHEIQGRGFRLAVLLSNLKLVLILNQASASHRLVHT